MVGKGLRLQKISNEPIAQVLNRFIEGYVAHKEVALSSLCIHEEVKHLIAALENEKATHFKNNESLDRINEILSDMLKREDISQEERKDIYRLLSQISNIHRESQLQKSRHVTSRVITAMGIAGSVAISIGSILLHEKYKTQREREKWNNYFERR
ncbi:hypothetical protein GOM49_00990 [Clostridium bovifaecis]|uniref:Uncharacterized protein n=1 Tax=Clostridium bovifaecis TaxID=2184719 RepID=A0A6I6EJR1_9CLOT|nr:hypothetical protein GOM49_00990 [Clostridium bovifaecis]